MFTTCTVKHFSGTLNRQCDLGMLLHLHHIAQSKLLSLQKITDVLPGRRLVRHWNRRLPTLSLDCKANTPLFTAEFSITNFETSAVSSFSCGTAASTHCLLLSSTCYLQEHSQALQEIYPLICGTVKSARSTTVRAEMRSSETDVISSPLSSLIALEIRSCLRVMKEDFSWTMVWPNLPHLTLRRLSTSPSKVFQNSAFRACCACSQISRNSNFSTYSALSRQRVRLGRT